MSHVAPPAACLTDLLAQARAGDAGFPAAGQRGGALRLRQHDAARGLLSQKVLLPHALQRCSDLRSAKRISMLLLALLCGIAQDYVAKKQRGRAFAGCFAAQSM